MKKAIIGVVSKHHTKEQLRPDTYIRDEIKQAIFDNGGIAIGILHPKDERLSAGDNWDINLNDDEYNDLILQINLCDGIIFQGGFFCDNYEMIVAKYCYENDIPTLGICCGQNVMVRALGGTTKKIENVEKHLNKTENYVHDIEIDKSSKFYQLIKKENIKVNSRHKKVIDKCNCLDIVAHDDDGNPEVVESKNKKFYLAVRFHPESLYKLDENINNIFVEFINTCKSDK